MSVIMTPSTGSSSGAKVLAAGSNIQALYSGVASVIVLFRSAAAARLVPVQGNIVVTIFTVFCRRQSVQVTRMRPDPSHSGNADENRPPGEIAGTAAAAALFTATMTLFCVAGCMPVVADRQGADWLICVHNVP